MAWVNEVPKTFEEFIQSLKKPTLPEVVSINVDELGNPILVNGKIIINYEN